MGGYDRYLFPVMPLSSCFFLLLIYEAFLVWRRASVAPSLCEAPAQTGRNA
jgi:hypothetical protein